MRRDPEAFLRALWGLDDMLAEHDFPRISPWWRATIERFYRSGKRRLVIRKGRRVGASTIVSPRLVVAEMLWGEHHHTPGAPPLVFAFLSVKRSEAANRLRGIKAILDIIGERYRENAAENEIELLSRPALAKVMTASFRTTVGETVAFAWCDEVSRWNDSDVSANPAEQIIASLAPALTTLPDATLWLCSSPLSLDDYHARAYELGETDVQAVAFGETWTINPTISEQDTQRMEPDKKLWAREYAAIPQAAISAAFDADLVAAAFRPRPLGHAYESICVVDGSSGGGDSFAWGIAGYVHPTVDHIDEHVWCNVPRKAWIKDALGERLIETEETIPQRALGPDGRPVVNPEWIAASRPVLVFHVVDSIDGRFAGRITGDEVFARVVRDCRRFGVRTLVADNAEPMFLSTQCAEHRLTYNKIAWSNANKLESVTRLKALFGERAIALPPAREKLKLQLHAYSERITPSGAVTYSGRGSHDDDVAVVLLAAAAELERMIPGSPAFESNYRHVVSR